MAKEATTTSKLEEKLTVKKELSWDKVDNRKDKKLDKFCEDYKKFIDEGKTEREAIRVIIDLAKQNGFQELGKITKARPGTKVYSVNRNKCVALTILGKEPIENGLNIIASHVDAPRLDLKQNPLYEVSDTKLALFKTHYYGGIKKYQWMNVPLAIHGRIVRNDGENIDIKIGEVDDDPIFTITDLLPHLSRKKMAARRLGNGIRGEELNILVGSRPIKEKTAKKKVKLWILDYLNKKYGMVEEDFVSAELEAVPAGKARDIGFDRSMVGAYGQDDRICAFTSLQALFDIKNPTKSLLALFVDKEEVGSDSTTSIKSRFLESMVGDLIELTEPDYRDKAIRKALEHSKALSADVTAGINPNFPDVHEKLNAAKLGFGLVITKFTGSGGKYSANDASAEFVGEIRRLFNNNKIPWQSAELGKVDEGGGGTIAKYLAEHNMDVLDCGPALLSMHSPLEIASKIDIYTAYEAYKAFYTSG